MPRVERLVRETSARAGLRARLLRGRVTLAALTDRLAHAYGDRTALRVPPGTSRLLDEHTTYTSLARTVARLATALRAAGVARGDVVAVVPSNGADFLVSFLAVVRVGAVAIPINPVLKPAEITQVLERSGARAAIGDAATIVEGAPVRWLSLGPAAPTATDVLAASAAVGAVDRPVRIGRRAVVAVLFTSGTTGTPKGARLTSAGIMAMTGLASLMPSEVPGSLGLTVTALPLAHMMGLGAALLLLCAGVPHLMLPRFDARKVLDLIESERADAFAGVPAMFQALMDEGAETRDLSSVRVWFSAADMMPAGLTEAFRRLGRSFGPAHSVFVELYGMVELSGAAMVRLLPPIGPALGWVAIPPYRLSVRDANGIEVPRGTIGQLFVKGPGVMAGYHRDQDLPEGGWLPTGDLARATRLRTFELAGRDKDVIKVGGYSVFPSEIEEEIRRAPGVVDAAVASMPDRRLGRVPVAAVITTPETTTEDLARWAKGAIASYRRPRRWIMVDAFPRGNTGKVDREAIVRRFTAA